MYRIAPQLSGYTAGKVCLFVGKSPEHFKGALAAFMERTLGGGFFFIIIIFKTGIYCCSDKALLTFVG